MKVAVVTPYYQESPQQLHRCLSSVATQTYNNITHILVADGYPQNFTDFQNVEQIHLPKSHSDAGATPRAIGALSAFSRGYDAVAFLDADNWYYQDHIETMVSTMLGTAANAIIATRAIYALDGSELYVDRVESNGENMVDTNCMFLSNSMSHYMGFWITTPQYKMVSDRVFWQTCISNGIKAVRCDKPTVAYASKWAWHYQFAGVHIPDDAVWLEQDREGNFKTIKHKDRSITI
jgi:glycosyltransferase involved in cell wall biosynthesis